MSTYTTPPNLYHYPSMIKAASGGAPSADGLRWSPSSGNDMLWSPGAGNVIEWGYNPLLSVNDQGEPVLWNIDGSDFLYWGGP